MYNNEHRQTRTKHRKCILQQTFTAVFSTVVCVALATGCATSPAPGNQTQGRSNSTSSNSSSNVAQAQGQASNAPAASQNTASNTPGSNRQSGSGAGSSNIGNAAQNQPDPQPTWPVIHVSQIGKLQHPAIGNALTSWNGDLYSVGGYTGTYSLVGVYQLPATTLAASSSAVTAPPVAKLVARMPARTHDAAAVYIGSDLYVLGGGQSASYNTILRAHQGTVNVIAHLPSPLSDAVSVPFTQNGQSGAVLLGGYDGSTMNLEARFISVQGEKDRTGGKLSMQSLFKMPQGLRYTAAVASGNTIYYAGGETSGGSVTTTVYAWSPGSAGARVIAHLPVAIDKAAAFFVGHDLLVAGGKLQNGQPTKSVYAIDVRSGKVKLIGHLPTPLADMGYTQVGSTGYLAGGQTSAKDVGTTVVYAVSLTDPSQK